MDVRILGPLEVRDHGEPLVLGGPKQRALLGILLLNAGRVVARDRLIDELWADDPPAAAGHALDVNISRLRKALGSHASALVTRAGGYLVEVGPDELDLSRFEARLATARAAWENGDHRAAARAFRDAEQLWRGRPLADLDFERLTRTEIQRLEELHLTLVEDRIEVELALGRHGALVGELEALTAVHPLRERLHAQLMTALYRAGRQADALPAYLRARSALVEQVGAEPGPELRALQHAILVQDPALDLPRRADRAIARHRRGLVTALALAAAAMLGAGALLAGRHGTAGASARTADAERVAAQALLEPDVDRSLLLARQAVELDDSPRTRDALAGALARAPAALGVLRVTRAELTELALSPDGRTLVVGDHRGDVSFVDPATRRAIRAPYRSGTPYIRQLVFNRDGSRLAVGCFGAIHLLDPRSGRRVAVLDVPGNDVQFINVAFSPDGRMLVAMYERALGAPGMSRTRSTLLRFDGRTGKRLDSTSRHETGSMADVTAFAPDGRWIITAARAKAVFPGPRIWRVLHGHGISLRSWRTLRPLRTFPATAVTGALSADGRMFAAAEQDGGVRLLDVRSGRMRRATSRHEGAIRDAAFTSGGRVLVTVGEDGKAIVWDVASATATETFSSSSGRMIALAVHAGRLYTGVDDGTVRVWDLDGRQRLIRPFVAGRPGADSFLDMTLSADGRSLATQQRDGSISLVDLSTLKRRSIRVKGASARTSTPFAPAFEPHGALILGSASGPLWRIDRATSATVLRGHRAIVRTPAVAGDTAATVSEDGTLRTWDIAHGREDAAPITLPGAPSGNPALSPDGTRIAVPIRGGPLAVFDARSRRQIARVRVDDSPAASASFSRDGRILTAASAKGAVRLYTARDLHPLSPLLPAGARASADLSPDNKTLVSADVDGRIRLWDPATNHPVGTAVEGPGHVSASARFSPDGAYVYAVFANGRAYRWDVRLDSWKRRACSIAGRQLTRREWHDALPDRPYHSTC